MARIVSRGDAAGGLDFQGTFCLGVERHAFAHGLEREIVQQRNVGAGVDRGLQLRQILDLDFDRYLCRVALRCGDRRRDSPGRRDVIFLDENSVEQSHAMIVSAADAHRVFLRGSQPGNGLASIQQAAAGSLRAAARSDAPRSRCRSAIVEN